MAEEETVEAPSFAAVALEATQNLDAMKVLDKYMTSERISTLERDYELLKRENNLLKEKLSRQKEDEADVYYYLHKKIDDNYDIIESLEQQIAGVKKEREIAEANYTAEIGLQKEKHVNQIAELNMKIQDSDDALETLRAFREKKDEIEKHLAFLEKTLEAERAERIEQSQEMERQNVKEKEILKKEMLIKIKETKQNLLSMTEEQLHTTTKRTMMENEQMIGELQYQSKEIEKLLLRNSQLEEEVVKQKRKIQMFEETEKEFAKRTHFYQKLIDKLHEKLKKDELQKHQQDTVAQDEEQRKQKLNEENKKMINSLQAKADNLETNLREVSEELVSTRAELNRSRAERNHMLKLQDDSVAFLLNSLDDISDQIALGRSKSQGEKTSPSDNSPSAINLTELAPSDREKVIRMLLNKLQAYQHNLQKSAPRAPSKKTSHRFPPIASPGKPAEMPLSTVLPQFSHSFEVCESEESIAQEVHREMYESKNGNSSRSIGVQTISTNLSTPHRRIHPHQEIRSMLGNRRTSNRKKYGPTDAQSPSKKKWDQANALKKGSHSPYELPSPGKVSSFIHLD